MKFLTQLLDWLQHGKTIFKKGGQLLEEAGSLKKNMQASIQEIKKDGLGLDDLSKIKEHGQSLMTEAKNVWADTKDILKKKTDQNS